MRFLRALVLIGMSASIGYSQRQLAGEAEIRLALEKLRVTGSVLMIAAHPDDENTAVLAYYARGKKLRTGYLSLNRGEGGQNLIGSEQGADIGLIRTQELLAARRIDGAEQMFTRAIDFGFSKTADETLQKWGRDQVLGDVVYLIRQFQPDVIINRFSGTERDGHGNHQVSAILSKEAFRAAADPARFPEQLKTVQPWQAKRLLWNVFAFTPEQEKAAEQLKNKVLVDTGTYDPVLGFAYNEIAGMSRSQHRSQAMGSPERKGTSPNYMVLVDGEPMQQDVFDGVDLTWKRVAGGQAVDTLLEQAVKQYDPHAPAKIVPTLLQARRAMKDLKGPVVDRKRNELDEAILKCAGIWVEAIADRFAGVPGTQMKVNVQAIARGGVPVSYAALGVTRPDEPATDKTPTFADLPANKVQTTSVAVSIPADAAPSQPYWLREDRKGELYTLSDRRLLGRPQNPPEYVARFAVKLDQETITLTRAVIYRYVDQVEGELIRPFVIVPPVSVSLAEKALLFPSAQERPVEVIVTGNLADVTTTVKMQAPADWKITPPSKTVTLKVNESQTISFRVQPPSGQTTGELKLQAEVNGRVFDSAMHVIRYPHIPPITTFPVQTAKLVREDVRILSRKVGYVMGAGDEVPEALRQLGCEVKLLTADDLERGDLSQYDAIVAGVRAFNTRADLRGNHTRLMDYVRDGGTYVMQYNVLEGGFQQEAKTEERIGPYPVKLSRERVTVEEAPVSFIHPDSRLLTQPNKITEKDFEGWVQERGLYFPNKWDDHYQTLLSSHDPNEKALDGGTLFTKYGRGVFIYSSYAFFRQLPAGVPGAYRLFANLLSAGKTLP